MASNVLLAGTTSAVASDKFVVEDSAHPVTLFAVGLATTEAGDLQVSPDEGATWSDVYESGSQTQLLITNTITRVQSPGTYRINKDATAGATAIYLNDNGNSK